MVTISVGISGSGKTTYGNKLLETKAVDVVVCPDDIRAELGDISDQSTGDKVFRIIYKQLDDAMKAGKNIYYSATNLTKKNRSDLMSLCKKYNQDITAVIFLTSLRPDICEKRVGNDLNNGICRSNTLVKVGDGKTVVQMQAEKFKNLIKNIGDFERELKEGSKSFKIEYVECAAQ